MNRHFRKDINGLRAIAVIAVVLFHFDDSWMPGGFAGVDVFFVISGFLMTGIIFRGLEQDNFSIMKFYIARANRIIPALAVLCIALLVFGWFYLTPLDYRVLGKHIGSSIGFISNFMYWGESGYFDAASHEKWLLHTWSLSVEWQFYIIYPLALVALTRIMPLKAMRAAVLAGTILAFIFCVVATYRWPDASYFLLPARAWEMMVGGVAYLYPIKLANDRKRALEWTGLALIAASCVFISKDNPWPGYLALSPALGTFLVIASQRKDSILTGNVVFQSLGKWSYSIYLWHWPLVVAIHYFSLHSLYIYPGIVLSVALGFLSNKYVENIRFKSAFYQHTDYLKLKPAYMVLIVGLLASYVYQEGGLDNRKWIKDIGYTHEVRNQLSGPIWEYANNSQCLNDHRFDGYETLQWWFCIKNAPKDPTVLLLGNSYANQLYPGFINNDRLKHHTILSVGTCGLDATQSDTPDSPCHGELFERQKRFINTIISESESLEYVIIDGLSARQNRETISRARSRIEEISSLRKNIKFILFQPHVRIPFHPATCYRRSISGDKVDCSFNIAIKEDIDAGFSPLIDELRKHDYNISYFDQNVVFCNKENRCSYTRDDLPLYRDSASHTSVYASILLQNHFNEWLAAKDIDMFSSN